MPCDMVCSLHYGSTRSERRAQENTDYPNINNKPSIKNEKTDSKTKGKKKEEKTSPLEVDTDDIRTI
jgi:hypothetical protein